MKQLVFATNNAHKLGELRSMLAGRFQVVGLADIGCHDDIPEAADTFEGNALAKAQWVLDRYGLDCIADDSGLEVDALGGEPGIHSARFAGVAHDDAANNALLLSRLDGVANRSACFRTVIALVRKDAEPMYFHGTVEGKILEAPKGDNGFGYDPLFVPDGWNKTFAEAGSDEKNSVSHRGRAVRELCRFLFRMS